MPAAARVTDNHICPMVTPGTPPVPHVGGPIIPPCSPNVITGGQFQARQTDKCTCVGPVDAILKGSLTVFVNGLQAARIGDPCVHGGTIVTGFPTVLIGDGVAPVRTAIASFLYWAARKLNLSEELLLFRFTREAAQWKVKPKAEVSFTHDWLEQSKSKSGYMKEKTDNSLEGLGKSIGKSIGKDIAFKAGVSWQNEDQVFERGDESDKVRLFSFDREVLLGVKGDLSGELSAGLFADAKVAVVTAEAKGKALNGLLEGKVEGEVASASASVDVGFKKSDEFTGFEAEAGAEAVAFKAAASGSVKISPKTVYDNTCGVVARWWTGDESRGHLSEAWDHGVQLGGKVEGGYGAAAKAGVRIGKQISVGASIGAGPMLGFKALIGIY